MEEERVIQNNPLVICAFGWGQIFRLYPNRLYARGRYYDLNELTQVHLVYQHIFGIPSARLELRFAHKLLILRGIAAIADADKAAEYLKAWCGGEEPVTDYSAALASALTLPPTRLFQEGEVPSERRGLSGSSPGRGKAVSGYPHTSERSQGITPTIPSPDLKEVETSSADGSKEYRMSVSSTGGNLDVDRLEMIKTNISLPTPTMTGSLAMSASPTASEGQGGNQQGTPTPVPTAPKPQPTPPIVTVRPVIHTTPSPTPSPTATPSPTPVPTQTDTPTPGPTPTASPTVTPTDTPSPGSTATATTTPGPDPMASATAGGGTEVPGMRGGAGTTDQQNGNSLSTNCLNDNLEIAGNDAVLSALENYFWIIVSCSILGTVAFYGSIYRLYQKKARRSEDQGA